MPSIHKIESKKNNKTVDGVSEASCGMGSETVMRQSSDIDEEQGRSRACNRRKCFLCARMKDCVTLMMKGEKGKEEKHQVVGVEDGTCQTPFVIYCIACNSCNHQYIGKSNDPLSKRMRQYQTQLSSKGRKRKIVPAKQKTSKKSKNAGEKERIEEEEDTDEAMDESEDEAENTEMEDEAVETSTSTSHLENVKGKKVVKGVLAHMKICATDQSKLWENLEVTILHVSQAKSDSSLDMLETEYIRKTTSFISCRTDLAMNNCPFFEDQ
ncbi:unnamed protein product [Darwinula stevensoni]|uniref:GIY-YIG domain-containing protein n=1 Tax=Darwinula stevensoni TaxID=69355 RepID=A0A7R8X203_9CRUS|nr:unnamed protein product [Darwinula stevensoni]CAG0882745.1 unnamed protein product [Darwinula stevensoni]